MPRNRMQWSEQEQMMAGAYANIASSFSQITAYMKNHLRTVQNGGGVINEGDMEDILQQLSDMINKNLHNASQMRVKITTENVAPKKITTKNTNSNWVSTASNGSPVQFESKQPQKIRISESELKQIITESVKNIISELDYTTYANAASASKDKDDKFRGYPSKQSRDLYDYAFVKLSRQVCGEDDFALFLAKYIQLHGVDNKIQKMMQQYTDGQKYIQNNQTKWSKK